MANNRESREKALQRGYEKAVEEIYRRMFTMDSAERITRKRAEGIIDGLDVEFSKELFYIGQIYGDTDCEGED